MARETWLYSACLDNLMAASACVSNVNHGFMLVKIDVEGEPMAKDTDCEGGQVLLEGC